jgi:hypothetical protein
MILKAEVKPPLTSGVPYPFTTPLKWIQTPNYDCKRGRSYITMVDV